MSKSAKSSEVRKPAERGQLWPIKRKCFDPTRRAAHRDSKLDRDRQSVDPVENPLN
jgi:hypothetical protein